MRSLLVLLLLATPLLADQPTNQALALVKAARSQVGVTKNLFTFSLTGHYRWFPEKK